MNSTTIETQSRELAQLRLQLREASREAWMVTKDFTTVNRLLAESKVLEDRINMTVGRKWNPYTSND